MGKYIVYDVISASITLVSLHLLIFVLQYYSPWVATLRVLHVNSPSPFRTRSMMDAPLQAGMMATDGAPPLRTTMWTNPSGSALKLVGIPCARLLCPV